jgi:hypothetical protein
MGLQQVSRDAGYRGRRVQALCVATGAEIAEPLSDISIGVLVCCQRALEKGGALRWVCSLHTLKLQYAPLSSTVLLYKTENAYNRQLAVSRMSLSTGIMHTISSTDSRSQATSFVHRRRIAEKAGRAMMLQHSLDVPSGMKKAAALPT